MNVTSWLEKVKKVQKEADLSRDEDVSIAIMNLISLEEHLFFTTIKTSNQSYLDMLEDVRGVRTAMMKKLVKDPTGEEWCISKHLLAASMRLIEVGTKELHSQKRKEAQQCFSFAFQLYSLFFAINTKQLPVKALEKPPSSKLMEKFSGIVKKLVDCCKEW